MNKNDVYVRMKPEYSSSNERFYEIEETDVSDKPKDDFTRFIWGGEFGLQDNIYKWTDTFGYTYGISVFSDGGISVLSRYKRDEDWEQEEEAVGKLKEKAKRLKNKKA